MYDGTGGAEYWAGLFVRYWFADATDRGANAVKAGLAELLDLKDDMGFTADWGGRAGNDAGGWLVAGLKPGGVGYDMMNV